MSSKFVPFPARIWKTTKEVFRELPELYGGQDLFREKDGHGGIKTTSVQEFYDMTASLGAALDTLGLLEHKVALLGETSVKWVATFMAQTGGGGAVVPLDRDLPPEEIIGFMQDSGAAALVFSPTYRDMVEAIKDQLPDVIYYIAMEGEPRGERELSLDDLISAGAAGAQAYMRKEPSPKELAAILYTSGTTGKSKGVMLSHENMMSSASYALNVIRVGKVSLSVLPIHHAYELSHGILMMMINSTTICINDSLRYFVANLQLFQPEILLVVPLFVEMLYNMIWKQAEAAGTADELRALIEKSNALRAQGIDKRAEFFAPIMDKLGGRLKLMVSGGAPLQARYQKGFDDLGLEVLQGYGITECGPVLACNPSFLNQFGTIGVPLPCSEIKIADMDENGEGELCAKGSNVMMGYYNNPEATAAVMEDGWFHTGDLGTVNEDGYFSITGRQKNLIVLANGKNVHPEEIEEYLLALPAIREVIVYAPMEPDGTQRALMAEIYPDEDFARQKDLETLKHELEELLAPVNHKLPGYKQITDITLRDTPFEKTTKKSIKRFKLRRTGQNS